MKRLVQRCGGSSMAAQAAPGGAAVDPTFIEVAHQLADAAAAVTTKYFRSPVEVDIKSDASPVTVADRQAEEAMRQLLAQRLPAHGVFGEEAGLALGTGGDSEFVWVLDPIDGTKSFITGKPLFGTLISLLHHGVPVLGIIDQPVLKERWLGVAGQPTTLNGAAISTRACEDVGSAYMYSTTPHMFSGDNLVAWERLRDKVRIPLYGCDCYAYGLLAAGLCDLVVEADLKPYDYMALVPVVQGAGGVITDWRGAPLHWLPTDQGLQGAGSYPGEVIAAGDPRTHEQGLELLGWR